MPFVPLRPDADNPGRSENIDSSRMRFLRLIIAGCWSRLQLPLDEHEKPKDSKPAKIVIRGMWSSPIVFQRVRNGQTTCADATLSARRWDRPPSCAIQGVDSRIA